MTRARLTDEIGHLQLIAVDLVGHEAIDRIGVDVLHLNRDRRRHRLGLFVFHCHIGHDRDRTQLGQTLTQRLPEILHERLGLGVLFDILSFEVDHLAVALKREGKRVELTIRFEELGCDLDGSIEKVIHFIAGRLRFAHRPSMRGPITIGNCIVEAQSTATIDTMRCALVALLMVGCGAAPSATNMRANAPLRVTWSEVTDTAPCFYFSGPEALGRNDHLGTQAFLTISEPHARLDFGSNIVFSGAHQEGAITLHRSSSHDYNEGKWESEETITLQRIANGSWVGRYHYDERDPETRTVGRCHIDATLRVDASVR